MKEVYRSGVFSNTHGRRLYRCRDARGAEFVVKMLGCAVINNLPNDENDCKNEDCRGTEKS